MENSGEQRRECELGRERDIKLERLLNAENELRVEGEVGGGKRGGGDGGEHLWGRALGVVCKPI